VGELSVAAAQTLSARGAVAANLEHHCRLAMMAADAGVDVVVFPELSLTGYELDIAETLAFSAEDERLESLLAVAGRRDVSLVVGAPVRLASGLHLAAFLIEPDGNVRVYTKRHLHGDENAVFVPGSLDPILELGDDRAALAICADTTHPEHAEAAAKRGASLYLAGVFFSAEGYSANTHQLAGYAASHAMVVVMANAAGTATGFASAGGSAVWSDSGDLVARLDGICAGLVVAKRSQRGWSGEAVPL
jgi:predicted amidohydrolase